MNDNARWRIVKVVLGSLRMPRVSRSMESLRFLENRLPVERGAMKTGIPPLLFTPLVRFRLQGSALLLYAQIPPSRFCSSPLRSDSAFKVPLTLQCIIITSSVAYTEVK